MDPSTGTFTTMDTYQGSIFDPVSLHKYLYANANPVTYVDPSGYMMTHQDLEAGMAGSAEIDKAQASHSSFAFKVFKNLMKKVASGVAGGLIAVGDQVSAGVTDRDQLALAFRKGFLAGFAFSFATGKVAMALRYTLPFAGAVLSIQSFCEGNFWQGIYRLSWSVIGGVGLYKSHLNSKVPENTNSSSEAVSKSSSSISNAPKYEKANLWERLTVHHARTSDLRPNSYDEFSNPKIGPSEGALSRYRMEIASNRGILEPIEVQKLADGGYEIVDGHHRWLAATQMGLEEVPIKISNYNN